MRTKLLIVALAIGAGNVVVPPAIAQDGMLQRCLASAAEQADFSGILTISRGGRPLANIVRGRVAGPGSALISANTRFNLGSASKMFTAVAVGQLVDSGRVSLDDRIGRFVSGLTAETSAITIRQLLTHSAGLGGFFAPQNIEAMQRARTASDLLPLIAGERPAFTPGSRFEYSNSGFALLGILIERVSGMSYGDYLARHVFAPAGMSSSGVDPNPVETLAVGMTSRQPGAGPSPGGPGRVLMGPDGRRMEGGAGAIAGPVVRRPEGGASSASPLSPTGPLRPAPGAQIYGTPAGGVFSTAEDLRRFADALLANRLTRPATTRALTSSQIVAVAATAEQPERYYGFGFGVGTVSGHQWFGHNGGTLGANGEFAVFPQDQLTITVLANRDPPMATNLFALARNLALDSDAASHCISAPAPNPVTRPEA